MNTTELPIDRLHAHPSNSNAMPAALFAKLKAHLAATSRYPPVIVRPHGEGYQVLDGHHRVKALRELQRSAVRCDVWEVDDAAALLLLATLNRLEGRDDPRRRAALLGQLRSAQDGQSEGEARDAFKRLARLLPEDGTKLRSLLRLNEPRPTPSLPVLLEAMPVSLHFFVLPHQKRAVEARLRAMGGSRESALLSLLRLEAKNDSKE